ncbi:MAG: hypothetical protein COB67_07215 [SAR324 cluster bacterium]|uniref:Glycosyl transferase family 1 domain-containing protein n=1 Tax=SAR324 cluster bacterium TaxID=2024889 RepID=A0A2A4T4I5_9DELT|nr:MAG: hypothetical protein COB67_07215 [SAR324 cluster bacterium]
MKILLVHNKYLHQGGEDTVFEAEYELLVSKGHDVEKVVFDNKELGGSLDKISLLWKVFFNLKSLNTIDRNIASFKPEIIHVHNFFPIASPSIFYSANKHKVPILMTLHNYRLICPSALMLRNGKVCELCIKDKFPFRSILFACYRNSRIQSFLLSSMLYAHKLLGTWESKIDRYITLTHFAKEKFLYSSLKIDSSKFVIKPNFTNNDKYEYVKEEYCLFVGRLSEEKGIGVLLESFSISKRQLIVIGDGPLKEMVERYVNEYTNITYLGFQNKDVILEIMLKAKALVFPSICLETFGMTIIEAFSCGTPIICSSIGAPQELVIDGLNGFKFQVGDANSLNDKVELLFKDSVLYNDMCKNARLEYEKKYTAEKNYEQLIAIYRDVIND